MRTRRRIVEDLEIISLVKQGDTDAFSLLIEKYHKSLLGFIFRLVQRSEIVEDIGQEVFLSAYQSIENFDAGRGVPFSAWLFTIARNRCISEIRRRRTRREEPFDDAVMEYGDPIDRDETNSALESAMSVLEEPFKSALLDSLKGFTVGEIAAKNNVSRSTVKTRLFRARQKVRKLLGLQPKGLLS